MQECLAPIDLNRCEDCCLAHYCSFECQKAFWPEHRKVCCSFTSNDTFSLAVRPLDNDFAEWLVVQDFEHLKDNCYFFYDDFPPETEVFSGEMADEVPEGTNNTRAEDEKRPSHLRRVPRG